MEIVLTGTVDNDQSFNTSFKVTYAHTEEEVVELEEIVPDEEEVYVPEEQYVTTNLPPEFVVELQTYI